MGQDTCATLIRYSRVKDQYWGRLGTHLIRFANSPLWLPDFNIIIIFSFPLQVFVDTTLPKDAHHRPDALRILGLSSSIADARAQRSTAWTIGHVSTAANHSCATTGSTSYASFFTSINYPFNNLKFTAITLYYCLIMLNYVLCNVKFFRFLNLS